MPLHSEQVRAVAGELYAHLFENRETGMPRGLYWNLHVECEPVIWEGEAWTCSLAVEWLALGITRFDAIAGLTLADLREPDMVEASLYIGEHHDLQLERLEFGSVRDGHVQVRIAGTAAVEGMEGLDVAACRIAVACDIELEGVFVVPGNLEPKPGSAIDARVALAPHFDVSTLDSGEFQRFKYVFKAGS